MSLLRWIMLLLAALGCAEPALAKPPTSRRAQAAIARVGKKLDEALAKQGLRRGAPIFLRIFKRERQLELWVRKGARFERFRTYPICTFSGGLGPKQEEGDMMAPEGFYSVGPRALNPSSSYHLSFNLGYPNAFDRANGRTGSALMVHGSCVSIGCYAMTDPFIEEIYAMADAALRAGQPAFSVHIFPFRMTQAALEAERKSPHHAFWSDLKVGHDLFEVQRRPPRPRVKGRRYFWGPG